MRIGIISDTHDLLRQEVRKVLSSCDRILHAGDITRPELLRELEEIAPVTAVRGNCDGDWAAALPTLWEGDIGGVHILMTHRRRDLPSDLTGCDIAVFGHSHRYCSDWSDRRGGKRTLLLNPGSCGPLRFRLGATMTVLTVSEDGFTARRIDLSRETAAAQGPGEDLKKQIGIVLRETGKGRSVEEIARKWGMDPELTERIVRLIVTHPGVTEEGIMTKMGL